MWPPRPGGGYSFTYTITNPTDDGALTYETSVSWITDVSDSGSTISFNVSENDTDASRTGRISLTYKSSYGSDNATVTVAQNAGAAPTLSVQPVAVTAEIAGGTYSFSYTVTNPADDGELSCKTTADWITDFNYTTSGKVSFTVAANSTTVLRSADISVIYDSSYGTLEETVAVVQDHEGSAGASAFDGTMATLVGTYSATGYAYSSGTATEQTWTLKIYEYDYYDYAYALIDGLTPSVAGSYEGEGDWADYEPTEAYIALGVLSDNYLMIPTQLTGYYNKYGYIGWTPCAGYSASEGWSYFVDSNYNFTTDPYTTFTYDESTGTWTSDYGEFLGLFEIDSNNEISAFSSFMDVVNPGVVLTKTSDATSTSAAPSAYINSLAEQIISSNASGMVFHPINEGLQIHTDFICK